MTEIPEHLLKRSRERRAALGLGGDTPAGESAPASETPSTEVTPAASTAPATTPAAPAPVEEPKPEPPKPIPAYVQAAQRRRRVPYWAMPVLAGLPLWGYVFYSTLEPAPVENDPLVLGEVVYADSGCAGCHTPSGAGQGNIPGFIEGAVQQTWPDPLDQMMWVRLGSTGWPADTYGAQPKPKNGGMPAHGGLTDQELAQVVLYERRVLGDEEAPPLEEDVLLQIANGEMTFEEAGLGELSAGAGVSESDLAPGG